MAAPLHAVRKRIKHTDRHQTVQFKVITSEFIQIIQYPPITELTCAINYKVNLMPTVEYVVKNKNINPIS